MRDNRGTNWSAHVQPFVLYFGCHHCCVQHLCTSLVRNTLRFYKYVLNTASIIVTLSMKHEHINQILNWLHIEQQSHYKHGFPLKINGWPLKDAGDKILCIAHLHHISILISKVWYLRAEYQPRQKIRSVMNTHMVYVPMTSFSVAKKLLLITFKVLHGQCPDYWN